MTCELVALCVDANDPAALAWFWGGVLDRAVEDAGSGEVDAGADVDWRGWDDLTPLGAAERAGATDLVAWLRERGARP